MSSRCPHRFAELLVDPLRAGIGLLPDHSGQERAAWRALVVDTVFGDAPFDSANAAVRAVILPYKDPKGGPTNTMSIGSARAKPNEVRIAARSRSRTAINRLKFPQAGALRDLA